LAAWGEPSRPGFPPEGETGKGESIQNSLLPQATTYWLMPESALSPQPPQFPGTTRSSALPFSQTCQACFASGLLRGTHDRTQLGPLMLNYPSKTDLHYIFLLTALFPIMLVKFGAEALDFKHEDAGPLLPGVPC